MASFTWPAGIDITDGRIAPGEPVTSDLMTDYRDRDDYIQGLFDNVTGHGHTGAAGDGPTLDASSLGAGSVESQHLNLAGQEVSITAAKIGANGVETSFSLANLATDYAHYPRFRLNSNTNVNGCASVFMSNDVPTTAALGECAIYIEIDVSAVSGQTLYAASFWHQN